MAAMPHARPPLAFLIGRGRNSDRHGASQGLEELELPAWRTEAYFPREGVVSNGGSTLEKPEKPGKIREAGCQMTKAVVLFGCAPNAPDRGVEQW
jgi:hypothetical protein